MIRNQYSYHLLSINPAFHLPTLLLIQFTVCPWSTNCTFCNFLQGVPKKSIFLKFQDRKCIWKIWTALDHVRWFWTIFTLWAFLDLFGLFGPFWTVWIILDCLDHFGPFGPFKTVWTTLDRLDHFGPFWTVLTVLDHLDHFGPFGPFEPFWTVWTIWTILNCLDHFGPFGPF